ncbi:hypothetical protein NDU88_005315 [Pleurodeles waltl]|uniref:Uncharacterized protein n=1 Tax=Pleurodeles waltl TaxID=8319 RepID=A0AAV7L0X3_PLEWA|nr:hypothetical protein NDU88_005315 [Pleurodeles waltl]
MRDLCKRGDSSSIETHQDFVADCPFRRLDKSVAKALEGEVTVEELGTTLGQLQGGKKVGPSSLPLETVRCMAEKKNTQLHKMYTKAYSAGVLS